MNTFFASSSQEEEFTVSLPGAVVAWETQLTSDCSLLRTLPALMLGPATSALAARALFSYPSFLKAGAWLLFDFKLDTSEGIPSRPLETASSGLFKLTAGLATVPERWQIAAAGLELGMRLRSDSLTMLSPVGF